MLAGALVERMSGAVFQQISLVLGGIRQSQTTAEVMDFMSLHGLSLRTQHISGVAMPPIYQLSEQVGPRNQRGVEGSNPLPPSFHWIDGGIIVFL